MADNHNIGSFDGKHLQVDLLMIYSYVLAFLDAMDSILSVE